MPEYERKGECFDAAASTWVAMATYLIAVELTYDTIWDAINVRSKASMSQLNLPHGTDN